MENFNLFLKTGNKKNRFLKTTITGDFQACFMVFENWKKLIMVFENRLLSPASYMQLVLANFVLIYQETGTG